MIMEVKSCIRCGSPFKVNSGNKQTHCSKYCARMSMSKSEKLDDQKNMLTNMGGRIFRKI